MGKERKVVNVRGTYEMKSSNPYPDSDLLNGCAVNRTLWTIHRSRVAAEHDAGTGHFLYPGANGGAGTQRRNFVGAGHQRGLSRSHHCGGGWAIGDSGSVEHGVHGGEVLRSRLSGLPGCADAVRIFEARCKRADCETSERARYLCAGGNHECPKPESSGFLFGVFAAVCLNHNGSNFHSVPLSRSGVHRERNDLLHVSGSVCVGVASQIQSEPTDGYVAQTGDGRGVCWVRVEVGGGTVDGWIQPFQG